MVSQPIPDDPFLKDLLPDIASNGLYFINPIWTGRVSVVHNQGLEEHGFDDDLLNKRFDRIGVQTNKTNVGWNHGPTWIAQSTDGGYMFIHEYRRQFPSDDSIKMCSTAAQCFELLGGSTTPMDGYGANWNFFNMQSDSRMNIINVSAFWMPAQDDRDPEVKRLTIAKGILTQATMGDVEQDRSTVLTGARERAPVVP